MKFQKFQNLNVRSKELFSQRVKDEERKKEKKRGNSSFFTPKVDRELVRCLPTC